MAFLRLLLLLVVAQTVVYVCLVLYLRAARRDRIVADWPDHGSERAREAFVQARVAAYMARVRPRLAFAVYFLPIAMLVIYIFVTN